MAYPPSKPTEDFKFGEALLDNDTVRATDGDTSFVLYTTAQRPAGEGAPRVFIDEDGDEQTHLTDYQQFYTNPEGAEKNLRDNVGDDWHEKHEVVAVAVMVRVQGLG